MLRAYLIKPTWLIAICLMGIILTLEATELQLPANGFNFLPTTELVLLALLVLLLSVLLLVVLQARHVTPTGRHSSTRFHFPNTSPEPTVTPLRVVVVEGQTLLNAGIISSLAHESNIEVEDLRPADQVAFITAIRNSKPDAVVLDAARPYASPVPLFTMLQDMPALRAVLVSSDGDSVTVYGKDQVRMEDMQDLVALLNQGTRAPTSSTFGAGI
jgi:hypothetical protein